MRNQTGLGAALLLVLVACGSAPTTHFHSLMPAPGTGAARAAAKGWELLPVSVPVQVDQPQWVIRQPDDTLAVLENERWAAPLGDEIRAALAERLRERLPALRHAAGWRITIDVQRFDSLPGQRAHLEAEWSLRAADATGAALRCRSVSDEPATAGYAALAAAHRVALQRLGDTLADALNALDQGRPAACGR